MHILLRSYPSIRFIYNLLSPWKTTIILDRNICTKMIINEISITEKYTRYIWFFLGLIPSYQNDTYFNLGYGREVKYDYTLNTLLWNLLSEPHVFVLENKVKFHNNEFNALRKVESYRVKNRRVILMTFLDIQRNSFPKIVHVCKL